MRNDGLCMRKCQKTSKQHFSVCARTCVSVCVCVLWVCACVL
jgi:hypothetical protein